MKNLYALLFLSLLALSGCKENLPVQTVDWYIEHTPERLKMLEKCKANPGELSASPNCINATSAQFKNQFGGDKGVKATAPKFTR